MLTIVDSLLNSGIIIFGAFQTLNPLKIRCKCSRLNCCMNHSKSVTHRKIFRLLSFEYIIGHFTSVRVRFTSLYYRTNFLLLSTTDNSLFFFYDKNTFNFLIITHWMRTTHIVAPLTLDTRYIQSETLFSSIRWIKQAKKEKLRDEQGEGYDKVVHHAFIETTTTTTTMLRFAVFAFFPLRFTFK